MNDFSKEELMSLHEFLDDACKHYLEPVYIYDLRDKIKAMIDDYCDHELCDSDYDYQALRCRKCLEITE